MIVLIVFSTPWELAMSQNKFHSQKYFHEDSVSIKITLQRYLFSIPLHHLLQPHLTWKRRTEWSLLGGFITFIFWFCMITNSLFFGVGMILRAKPWNSFFRHNFIDHIIRGGHSVTKKQEDPSITFMQHRSRQEAVQTTKTITRALSPHTLVNAVSLPVMALHFYHYSPLS